MKFTLAILFNLERILMAILTSATLFAGAVRDSSFDQDWRFLRADAPGAETTTFDDSSWRKLDVPHDWSIEDLPMKANQVPELDVVTGPWRFHQGDDQAWQKTKLNDQSWQQVLLPDNWEHHSAYTADYVFGWYRRNIEIPADCKGKDLDLLLGRIDDADEAWINGVRIGSSGSFPPNFLTAWDTQRRYRVPASLLRGDGSDLLAVRVFDGLNHGGICEAVTKQTRIGPFDSVETQNRHFTGNTVGGIGWYRKSFTVNETNQRVSVRFDGVYMNPEIWINGQWLGEHPHGYIGFEFDLTPYLKPAGQKNVLALRVRNEGKNSRWYSGSGIYRHVWLTVTEPIHLTTWGVFVTTPEVSKNQALAKVISEVSNSSNSDAIVGIRVRLLDSGSNTIGSAESELRLPANKTLTTEQSIHVPSPTLWSLAAPNLYTAEVEVIAEGKTVDLTSTKFGIRKIEADSKLGFRLNGQSLELKGGCIHHDNGPLGAAALDRAEERKIELLKSQGFNAIRSSHNPPSSALLDACDRLGMLVIDEAFDQWNQSKEHNEQDYHRFFKDWHDRDIAAMIRRDRNHPSVIMWSVGNEIPEQFSPGDIGIKLRQAVLAHDPTRPITQAISTSKDWDKGSDPAFAHLDIAGYNYLPEKYESDHQRHPDRVILSTESYPKDFFDYWTLVEKHPYVIGDFVWTAMDYLGEAGIGHSLPSNQKKSFFMPWPWVNAWCGDLDLCGFKKPQSFYRDVVWRRSPIEMAVHAPLPPSLTEIVSGWGWPDEAQSWNWPGQEGQPLQVSVYTRCEKVRLALNGKVVGEKPVSAETKLTAKFDVPYTTGELIAYGLLHGKVVAQTALKTRGTPKRLRLTADRTNIRADRNDLSYVTVELLDATGQRVPNAEISVRFSVSGAGELAGQASGSPNKPASFQAPFCTTFGGRCLAILRSTGAVGNLILRAEAEGMEPETLTVYTQ